MSNLNEHHHGADLSGDSNNLFDLNTGFPVSTIDPGVGTPLPDHSKIAHDELRDLSADSEDRSGPAAPIGPLTLQDNSTVVSSSTTAAPQPALSADIAISSG